MLKDKSYLLTAKCGKLFITAVVNIGIAIIDRSGSRFIQSANDMKQRTLSATGRSDNRNEVARMNRHAGVVERGYLTFTGTVDF